jgi:DNA-binding winged helix-turn-helix (wHTH) protein/TolB-like protein/thioredoxin-like negative regulator of GroEL
VKAAPISGKRQFYEFGPFRLDPLNQRLFRNGEIVPLFPKAIETLTVLVHHPGELLNRQALMDAVWPDAVVEEANLTVAVSQLRKALNQNGDKGEFIQTIPRIGYRFVGHVHEITEQGARSETKQPMSNGVFSGTSHGTAQQAGEKNPARRKSRVISELKRSRPVVTIGAVALVIVAAAICYPLFFRQERGVFAFGKPKTLAVLPFQVAQPISPEDEYLGPGIADSLNMRLSRLKRFAVRPTTSTLKFSAPTQDPVAAGRQLAVEGVIEGRIEHMKDRLRVTARLWRVADGALLWNDSFDAHFANFSAVEETISRQVAETLELKLSDQEQRQLASRATSNAEAFHAYLRGRYALNKRTTDEFEKALKSFQQAIDLDPGYAAAYAGLANCYLLLGDYDVELPNDAFPLAKAAALRALEIDDTLAEAHATLAHINFDYYWDWTAAEQEYLRAIELKPNYATAHHWYALFLTAMGRTDEARQEIKLAQELDPLSLIIQVNVGQVEYYARQYDKAIEQMRKVLQSNPEFVQARRKLAFVLEAKGLEQEAFGEWLLVKKQLGNSDQTLQAYRNAYAASGIRGYWRQALEVDRKKTGHEAESLSSYYAQLGDRDQAFYWLDRAYQEHAVRIVFAKVAPVYDNLRSDSRFAAFLQRMGL